MKPLLKKQKIPYAGYDASERQRRGKKLLKKARVLELKAQGMTVPQIAEFLAEEHDRAKDYSVDAIYAALRRPD